MVLNVKPSERHKLTSDNNIIKFKKPVHDPFNFLKRQSGSSVAVNGGSDFI